MKNLLLITALAITGCGAAGTHFDFNDAKTVKIGDTEKELVAKMKMPPYQITSNVGRPEVFTWAYATRLSGETGQVSFPLVDGKVVQLPKFPDDYEQK